jgi:hypothetical protein
MAYSSPCPDIKELESYLAQLLLASAQPVEAIVQESSAAVESRLAFGDIAVVRPPRVVSVHIVAEQRRLTLPEELA